MVYLDAYGVRFLLLSSYVMSIYLANEKAPIPYTLAMVKHPTKCSTKIEHCKCMHMYVQNCNCMANYYASSVDITLLIHNFAKSVAQAFSGI